jgi:hypothetical protein
MKSAAATVALVFTVFSTAARAQSPPPPDASAPASAEPEPATPPPSTAAAPPVAAEPPPPVEATRPAEVAPPPPATTAPRAVAAEPASTSGTKLAVAVQSTGFFSTLDNGFFVGGQGASGTVWGVGMSVSAVKLDGSSSSDGLFVTQPTGRTAYGFSIYPGAKVVLARAADGRVDLVGDLDVGFTKYYATDGVGSAISDGYGVWTHVGPGLRLWLTPSLALSYSALLDVLVRTGRAESIPGQVVSDVVVDAQIPRASTETTAGFFGRFTLLGVF